ncbi:MAG TPA: sodium:proton antiporter [Sphingomonadaceae bacterium]
MSVIGLSPFDLAALLVVAAAVLGWFNHHFLKLPHVIGLTVMGGLASILLLIADALVPGTRLDDWVAGILGRIDFTQTLLQGMLSFLLFAGALHVDLERLTRDWLPVLLLSTLGVIVSTGLVGAGMWGIGAAIGVPVAPIWYFVFGALISPTDPVSVLGVLKETRVEEGLQATVAGESLFNDGVGIVLFTILFGAAAIGQDFSVGEGARLFALQAGGGVAVGLVAGWLGYRAMHSMDEYALEVMISLAVVMGGYALCEQLHVSGPLAMAVAGLIIGNQGVAHAMSDTTRDYLIKFWELIDDLLNSVLFLLIGLEVIALVPGGPHLLLGAAGIAITLAARGLSLGLLSGLLPRARKHGRMGFTVLWWGGLRGGISIALALSLPAGHTRDLLLAATFAAVLFSVLVQRATLARLIARHRGREPAAALPPTIH